MAGDIQHCIILQTLEEFKDWVFKNKDLECHQIINTMALVDEYEGIIFNGSNYPMYKGIDKRNE
jgi:hypothetical protein